MGEMQAPSDAELLADYATRRSEAAFARLVERYVALVHSAARRQVSDPQLAEEITQAVFIILARKAGSLTRQTVLAGWLCRTAHFAARDALKAERRRRHREQLAAHMDTTPDAAWQQLAPLLDETVAQLREADRNAIVLRYYEQRPLDEIGVALGIGADAAQKRVARALERLRAIFTKRGVTLTAAAVAGAVSANAVQAAPVGLAAKISAAALVTGTTLTATTAIVMTTLQKTIIGATLAAAVGTGIYEAQQAANTRREVRALEQQQTLLAEQIQQLTRERDQATNLVAGLREEVERLNRNTAELLRLRGQVGQLQEKNQAFATLISRDKQASNMAQALSDPNTIAIPSRLVTPMNPPRPINRTFDIGQLQDMGNDSIEAAAQTALWAVLSRDEAAFARIRYVQTNAPPMSAEDQAKLLSNLAHRMEGVHDVTLNSWLPDPESEALTMVFFRAAWPDDSHAVDKPAGGTLVFRQVGTNWNLDSFVVQGRPHP